MAKKMNINTPKESALAVDTTSPFYRVCPYSSCNKPFMYTRSDQKYCSRKCQNDDYNKFRLTRKNTGGPPPESNADNNSSPLIDEGALKEINEPKQSEQSPESTPKEQISFEDPKELIYKMNINFLNGLVLNKDNEIILHTEVMMENKFDFTCSSGRVCDKVLKENETIPKKDLIELLRWTLRVNHIILVPTPKNDLFGHSDGVIRLINGRTVLINDFSKEDSRYRDELIKTLNKAKLNFIEIPYNPFNNRNSLQANGIYINYLHMKGVVFLPVFDMKEDETTIRLFEGLFKKEKIIPVESNEIANEGGILNCISWNIMANYKQAAVDLLNS